MFGYTLLHICGGPLSMHEFVLFEDKGGRPQARTVRGKDGTVRVADGVRFFSLDQAVPHFGMSRAELLEIWEELYADIPWAASPLVDPPAAAAAQDTGESPVREAPARDDRPMDL